MQVAELRVVEVVVLVSVVRVPEEALVAAREVHLATDPSTVNRLANPQNVPEEKTN